MKKTFLTFALILISASAFSQNDTVKSKELKSVSIVSSYRVKSDNGSLVTKEKIEEENNGKEPVFIFAKMPSIFAYGDNGSEFGYGYMRIRGLDQTHTNVTLDGMPWNEAEDFGCYFANSPDLMNANNWCMVFQYVFWTFNCIYGWILWSIKVIILQQ